MDTDVFFRIKNDSRTRGHSLALVKCHFTKKYTFSQRAVNDWNRLPEKSINGTSVNRTVIEYNRMDCVSK